MRPHDNPYTPNAGARPPALVGRDDQLESFEILLDRLRRGHTEQSMLITGLRGVGKTVLLTSFEERARERRLDDGRGGDHQEHGLRRADRSARPPRALSARAQGALEGTSAPLGGRAEVLSDHRGHERNADRRARRRGSRGARRQRPARRGSDRPPLALGEAAASTAAAWPSSSMRCSSSQRTSWRR